MAEDAGFRKPWLKALAGMSTAELDSILNGHAASPIDYVEWSALMNDDQEQDWLLDPFLAQGRAHALYAPAKEGKSLFVFAQAAALATGRATLRRPASQPLSTLYLDYEMTPSDIRERLEMLGYDKPDELEQLHYCLIPGTLGPLDTAAGGAQLAAEVQRLGIRLVIIDTTARAVNGDENEAGTFRDLFRHSIQPLKALGVTFLRADHAGKDVTKGQRGSSAKNDDVDIVWQLTRTDSGSHLKATHKRLTWVPDDFLVSFDPETWPAAFTMAAAEWPAGTKDIADKLDALGVPVDLGINKAQKLLKEANGTGTKTAVVSSAQKYRREREVRSLLPRVQLKDSEW